MKSKGLLIRVLRKALFVALCLSAGKMYGQSFFDIIPDLNSVEMQGGCRVLYTLDSSFIVFGHRYDTSYGGSNAKPWMGKFDYEGQMQSLYSLRDTSYNAPFNISFMAFAQKSSTRWYGYSARFINSLSTPYVFELDIRTGEIISSVLLPNQELPGEGFGVFNIYYSPNRISLLSYQQDPDSVRMYITELDSALTKIREFRVQAGAKKQFSNFFERNDDGTYLIVSDSRREAMDNYGNYNATWMHLDSNGRILEFKWSPSSIPISNTLVSDKSVIRGREGTWVLIGLSFLHPDSCTDCSIYIPYIYSVSPGFDSLLWQIELRDVPYSSEALFHEYGLTEVADGYVGCGEYKNDNFDWWPSSGRIYKTSFDGDSLWTRHIIPLGWDEDRVGYANFYDLKETPIGTLVIIGDVGDNELQIVRPWILHLDKDGCLVPGCQLVGIEDPTENQFDVPDFVISPNPFSSEIYLLSKRTHNQDHIIRLISNTGTVIHTALFEPLEGAQYMLMTDKVPPGMYYLSISNQVTGRSESFKLIKLD